MNPFDDSGAFRFVAESSRLRHLAVRGAGAMVSATGATLVTQVIGTVILARLLTPADFGVVTMVTTLSLLLESFGLNGFTEAVIQWKELDRYTVSNLFWLNSIAGIVLGGGLGAFGSLLARFYRNPLVANVAIGGSLTVFIAAPSVIHLALLKRAMRFSVVSANDVLAKGIGMTAAILMALGGWGYWALLAGMVAQRLSTTVGAWLLCRWIPSLPRRTGRTGAMVRFAMSVFGRFGLRYASQNIDNLLVGWKFNAAALGFYKKAYDLFVLSASQLTGPLNNVAVAALSRLNHDPARFRRSLINCLEVIAFVGMGVGGALTLVGKHVIRLVLGVGWEEAGRIFTFFGPGIGLMLLYSTTGWIHLSIGKPVRWLRWTVLEFVVTAGLLLLGLRWGPEGVAIAWSTSFWILTVPGFWYAGRPIEFGILPLLAAVWKYAVASFLAGCACAGMIRQVPSFAAAPSAGAALEAVIVISAVFLGLYLGSVILLHRGCAPIYQFIRLLVEIVTPESSASRTLSLEQPRMAAIDSGAKVPLVVRGDGS